MEKGASVEENESLTNDKKLTEYYSIEEQKQLIAKLRIEINGRNILDLGANLNDNNNNTRVWQPFVRYSHLPENNLKMFLQNRSQYHRLGANGHLQEYALVNCKCCDFIYPVNGYNNNNNTSTSGNNIMNSVKTNINNGQLMAGEGNMIIKPPVRGSPPRPITTQHNNQYSPAAYNSPPLKPQQYHEPNMNFDAFNFTTALNRTSSITNTNQSNNILENIAAALLNTTNNNTNHGLNQKHFNTHHYFNNNNNHQQQQHAFGGNNNHHFGNNHYASHSYSYKQF